MANYEVMLKLMTQDGESKNTMPRKTGKPSVFSSPSSTQPPLKSPIPEDMSDILKKCLTPGTQEEPDLS